MCAIDIDTAMSGAQHPSTVEVRLRKIVKPLSAPYANVDVCAEKIHCGALLPDVCGLRTTCPRTLFLLRLAKLTTLNWVYAITPSP